MIDGYVGLTLKNALEPSCNFDTKGVKQSVVIYIE